MLYDYSLLQVMYVISKLCCLYFNVVWALDSKPMQRRESCFENFHVLCNTMVQQQHPGNTRVNIDSGRKSTVLLYYWWQSLQVLEFP